MLPATIVALASLAVPSSTLAYEFRSGALMPGRLDAEGRFIPTSGAELVPLRDHRYSPMASTIWNLPGEFRAVSTPSEARQTAAALAGAAVVVSAPLGPTFEGQFRKKMEARARRALAEDNREQRPLP